MLGLIWSALAGFGTGFVPKLISKLLGAWQKDREHKHHIEALKLETEFKSATLRSELKKIKAENDHDLRIANEENSGIGWVDAVKHSMRPLIAVLFVLLFIALTGFEGYIFFTDSYGVTHDDHWSYDYDEAGEVVRYFAHPWLDEAKTILGIWSQRIETGMGAVIGFYFGSSWK